MTDIAFIGGGNMAQSLIGGLCKAGTPTISIHVAEPRQEAREVLRKNYGVVCTAVNPEAVQSARLWVFAVKPQILRSVCRELAPLAQRQHPQILSIAAGIRSEQIDRWLDGGQSIVRAMPNTPALLGAGATGLFANAHTQASGRETSEQVMATVGKTVWVENEALIDTVTALSGSGPAYLFLLAEAMENAAVAQGLPLDAARLLAAQTVLGAGRMLTESGDPAKLLRERVTSPGGTTAAALEIFHDGGFAELVAAALAAAAQRGTELAELAEMQAAP